METYTIKGRIEKEMNGIITGKDVSYQEKLDSHFIRFLHHLNGELDSIQNFYVIHDQNKYTLDYVFQPKAILFNFDLNTVQHLNPFFRNCHAKLNNGDVIAGRIELMEAKHRELKLHHSVLIYRFLITYEFIFKRFFPKLPGFYEIYTKLHLLKKQVLSKCEILGRLIYNGFEVVYFREIGNHFYFLCRKHEEPNNRKVNKGILFKQRRVGKDGKAFNFYKLRTMHPYAEFVQKYLIEENHLSQNGKVNNDFRIADWGRFLRRNWLDELPGIINLLKGDLRLFGVRPLSRGFFDIYPEDIQNERIKMKPGLIPPYYSDLPNSIEEVIESERNYLEKRKKAPLKTDAEYFLRAMKNILLKGARSA